MARTFIVLGVVFILLGLAWPWLARLGLGRLPGDMVIVRPGYRFYFPLTTSVIVSVVLTLLFWLFKK